MTEVLFWANCLLAGIMLVDGLQRREGYMEVPFLSAAMYAVWFLPQAAALLDDITLPELALARVLAMSLLCLGAIWLGWRKGTAGAPKRVQPLEVPVARLIWPTLVLTLFAAAMRMLIDAQPDEVRASSQWTGPITIMAFFASVGSVSLVLSLAMVFRRATAATLTLAAMNILLYAPAVLIYFRRAETFQLVFGMLIASYYFKGRTISRASLIVAVCIGYFFVNGISQLRDLGGGYTLSASGKIETRIPTLQEIMAVDWINAASMDRNKYISDTRNAAVFMAIIEDTGSFTFGGEIFSMVIKNYLPGQFVGFDLKNSIRIGEDIKYIAISHESYEAHTGSTTTGFVHPYRDWWFFGFIVFYIQSYAMGRVWSNAKSGEAKGFIIYATIIGFSLHSITHYGYVFIIKSIFPIIVILVIFRIFAREGGDLCGLRKLSAYKIVKLR